VDEDARCEDPPTYAPAPDEGEAPHETESGGPEWARTYTAGELQRRAEIDSFDVRGVEESMHGNSWNEYSRTAGLGARATTLRTTG
jgi:hypothetical protein